MGNLTQANIRQVITGIIHGETEITSQSARDASDKGKEIMDFLNEHNLLHIAPKCNKCEGERLEHLDNGKYCCIDCGNENT